MSLARKIAVTFSLVLLLIAATFMLWPEDSTQVPAIISFVSGTNIAGQPAVVLNVSNCTSIPVRVVNFGSGWKTGLHSMQGGAAKVWNEDRGQFVWAKDMRFEAHSGQRMIVLCPKVDVPWSVGFGVYRNPNLVFRIRCRIGHELNRVSRELACMVSPASDGVGSPTMLSNHLAPEAALREQ